MTNTQINFCYLFLVPHVSGKIPVKDLATTPPKDAPYFFDLDIKAEELPDREIEINQVRINISTQVLDGEVMVYECRYTFSSPKEEDFVTDHYQLRKSLRDKLISFTPPKETELYEEYLIILHGKTKGTPENYLGENFKLISSLLRSIDKPISKSETESILGTRVSYSKSDLTVVDWEGAVIVAEDGDYQPDIDLMKIGNYQLMRYRILDSELTAKLSRLAELVSIKRSFFSNNNRVIRQIVESRLSIILDYEKIDQSLLLIGDWYSAQLYRSIVDEFYIDDWKIAVKQKLDSLGEIYDTVSQNLVFTLPRILDIVQLVGWLVLLVGYVALFLIDAGWRLRG